LLRFIALFSALAALLVFAVPAAAVYPSVSGECAYLYIPDIDRTVYEKNAERRHPMASTTKIMTALVVLKNTAPNDVVRIHTDAVGIEGSSIYLQADQKYSVNDLLYAVLLASANDAAAALAIHTAGSISAFADMMNAEAEALGLSGTHFTNPHGLADDEHYTTAADLARITAAAMEHDEFCKIVATKSKRISSLDGSITHSLSNHNRLLRRYEDCVGVKTGFTKNSGRCLVSAAQRDGMLLIAVTLDAPNDWQDHETMLDYGFSQYEARTPDDGNRLSLSLPVVDGVEDAVSLQADTPPAIIVKKDSEPLQMQVEINRFAVAPVKKGDILGLLRYTQNGQTAATLPLRAAQSVEQIKHPKTFWDKIKSIWNG
jgi:D-alanyl-D-alanine carboxypeptidase/D-alanyl-D-alanine carboxypeptidase (penicillin-binding protein 5/6)